MPAGRFGHGKSLSIVDHSQLQHGRND
jgi:hypothetical protein